MRRSRWQSSPAHYDLGLNPNSSNYESVFTTPLRNWEYFRVNELVNKVANQSAACIEPATGEIFIEQNLF
jgi:hypothetical protein